MKRFEIRLKDDDGIQVIVAERILQDDGAWVFYDDDGNPVGMVERARATSIISTEIERTLEE